MSKFTNKQYKLLDNLIKSLITLKKTSSEISNELGISKSTIMRRCKILNLHIPNYHNALKFDNTVFDIIDTEEKAYWLGFLYADGNVHKTANIISLALKLSDIDHLQKFKTFLHASNDITTNSVILHGKEYYVCKFSICDKYFKEKLISLGCVPRKSLILKFPNIEIFQTELLIYDFIRGYIDGDGCLTFSKNGRLSLSIAGTYDMLDGICKAFPNMFASIHQHNKSKCLYIISNCGHNADEVTYKLYNNANIYLDRKYERFAVLNRKV